MYVAKYDKDCFHVVKIYVANKSATKDLSKCFGMNGKIWDRKNGFRDEWLGDPIALTQIALTIKIFARDFFKNFALTLADSE